LPPPDGNDPPRWAKDNKAKKEDRFWENAKKLQDAKTWADVLWARAYGFVAVLLLLFISLLFLVSFLAWVAHYVFPEMWHWLSDEQLSKIQSVIFSGSLGGIVSLVVQKQLSK